MSVIYEFDFPCGCHTQSFDPREWTLCERHESPQQAMGSWAGYGVQAHRALTRIKEFASDPFVAEAIALRACLLEANEALGLPGPQPSPERNIAREIIRDFDERGGVSPSGKEAE